MTDAGHLWTLCLAGLHVVTPANLWHAWSLAPPVIVPLMLALAAGLRGYAITSAGAGANVREIAARRNRFLAAWLLLTVALVSPLCRLSATLVSAHMVQLMLLAGPATALLALALPGQLAAALPLRWLRIQPAAPAADGAAAPPRLAVVTLGYGGMIWLWHAPPVYAAILESPVWHWLAFAALIWVATLFWVRVVAAHRHHAAPAVMALATTLMHTGLLGALLTFAQRPLYPIVAEGAAAWHLEPLQDQQLAGLIMWVGGGAFYLLAALVLCAAWLRALDAADTTPGRA
jgi:putative membrane protein